MTKQVTLKYWACDYHNSLHFEVSQCAMNKLIEIFQDAGIELLLEEEKSIPWVNQMRHNTLAIISSLYEVQGLKREEAISIMPAIESLIAKYVEMKNGK